MDAAPPTKGCYKFEQNVFKLSREKKRLILAIEEWELVEFQIRDKDDWVQCICSNQKIYAKVYFFYNPFTKALIHVGRECAKKFKAHAKPGMGNPATRDMLKDILKGMSDAEKAEYKDIANILSYCQGVIGNLVKHVDVKLRDGTPLDLTQLIECLTGILQRQEELYLPTEHVASLLEKLKARLAHLEEQAAIRAAALAAAEAVAAAERARRKAEHEAQLQAQKVAAEERAAKEAAEAEAREAAAAVRRQREAEWHAQREAERREQEKHEELQRQEYQKRARIAREHFEAERQGLIRAAEQRQRERIQKIIERQAAKKK